MNQYLSGLRNTIFFYVGALILATIIHLTVGWDYIYAPPMSVMILIGAVLIGTVRVLLDLLDLSNVEKRRERLGKITVHALVIAISVISVMIFVGAL